MHVPLGTCGRGHLVEVISFLPSCGVTGLHSDPWAWWQFPLHREPSCWPFKIKKKKKHSYNSILHFPNYFLRVNPCKWIKGMLIFKVSVLARTFKFHFTNGESTMQWLTEMNPLSPLWLIHHLQVTRWKTLAIIPAVTCSPLCGEIWAPATTSLFLWLL